MVQAALLPLEQPALRCRLLLLWERTGDLALHRLAKGESPSSAACASSGQERADWISTTLMNTYKESGDPQVFALLFELNRASFLQAIQTRLRRCARHLDAQDVLQEVFLNIYRYPHRFHADRADAFRSWGHRIVRNTLLKFLKGENRMSRHLAFDEEVPLPEDPRARSPERHASESERAEIVNNAYLLYLNLYLIHFQRLSTKERRALSLVEVDGVSYKDAATDLGIRLENLKMVIFRGRRKVFRGMARSLGQLNSR